MLDKALELYIYMCSSDKVIEIMEQKGIKTKEQAGNFLSPYVGSNILGVISLGGGSLAGTAQCVKQVLNHFETKENKKKVKKESVKKEPIPKKIKSTKPRFTVDPKLIKMAA